MFSTKFTRYKKYVILKTRPSTNIIDTKLYRASFLNLTYT